MVMVSNKYGMVMVSNKYGMVMVSSKHGMVMVYNRYSMIMVSKKCFVFIAIVMTSVVTVVAVLAVSKVYSKTTAMSTSFDRLHRRTNDAKEEITLPSYSDDVRIDLETDEI